MSTQNASPTNSDQDSRQMFNVAYFVMNAYASTIEVLLHHSFGVRYLGAQCFVGLALIVAVACQFPRYDLSLIFCYFWGVAAMMLIARFTANSNYRKGLRIHSYSSGISRLKPTKFHKGKPVSTFEEACVVGFLGGLAYLVDRPLGTCLFLGAICLVTKSAMSREYAKTRDCDLEDARIECEAFTASLRPHHNR